MILGNRGYNVYDVNKKNKKGFGTNGRIKWHWLAIQVWIANGIDEVSSVPVFLKLISLAQY